MFSSILKRAHTEICKNIKLVVLFLLLYIIMELGLTTISVVLCNFIKSAFGEIFVDSLLLLIRAPLYIGIFHCGVLLFQQEPIAVSNIFHYFTSGKQYAKAVGLGLITYGLSSLISIFTIITQYLNWGINVTVIILIILTIAVVFFTLRWFLVEYLLVLNPEDTIISVLNKSYDAMDGYCWKVFWYACCLSSILGLVFILPIKLIGQTNQTAYYVLVILFILSIIIILPYVVMFYVAFGNTVVNSSQNNVDVTGMLFDTMQNVATRYSDTPTQLDDFTSEDEEWYQELEKNSPIDESQIKEDFDNWRHLKPNQFISQLTCQNPSDISDNDIIEKLTIYEFLKEETKIQKKIKKTYNWCCENYLGYDERVSHSKWEEEVTINKNLFVITVTIKPVDTKLLICTIFKINPYDET